MDTQTVSTIVGTALSVGVVVAAAGKWALGMAIRENMQPLREAVLQLKSTADSMAKQIERAERDQAESRDELHEAVEAIRAVLSNHQERLAVLESHVPGPKAPAIRSARRKASS